MFLCCWKSVRNPNSKTFFPHKVAPNFFPPLPTSKNKQNSFLGGDKVRAQLPWELIPCCARVAVVFPLFLSECRKGLLSAGTCSRHKAILMWWVFGSLRACALLGVAALITGDSLGSRPSSLSPADSTLIWLHSGRLLQLSLSMTDLTGVDGDISWVWQLELWWCYISSHTVDPKK